MSAPTSFALEPEQHRCTEGNAGDEQVSVTEGEEANDYGRCCCNLHGGGLLFDFERFSNVLIIRRLASQCNPETSLPLSG